MSIPILLISPEVEVRQRLRLAEVRQSRDAEKVRSSLEALKLAAVDGSNVMPVLIECTRSYATLGEMCGTLAEVFGVYEEPAVF